MAPTIQTALVLIYTPTPSVNDRAAVRVRRGFNATAVWPMQTEYDDRAEIGDADMPDLVWDHEVLLYIPPIRSHPSQTTARSYQFSPL